MPPHAESLHKDTVKAKLKCDFSPSLASIEFRQKRPPSLQKLDPNNHNSNFVQEQSLGTLLVVSRVLGLLLAHTISN